MNACSTNCNLAFAASAFDLVCLLFKSLLRIKHMVRVMVRPKVEYDSVFFTAETTNKTVKNDLDPDIH